MKEVFKKSVGGHIAGVLFLFGAILMFKFAFSSPFYSLHYEDFRMGIIWGIFSLFFSVFSFFSDLRVRTINYLKKIFDKTKQSFWSSVFGKSLSNLSIKINEKTKGLDKKINIFLGKVVRAIFYIGVGIWGYSIASKVDISSVPLSQLTLSDIGSFVFGIVIMIYSVKKLFTPPETEEDYEVLGSLVVGIVCLGLLVLFVWYLFSRRQDIFSP